MPSSESPTMDPLELARSMATELVSLGTSRPVAVAVDGPDGSGRAALADRVAAVCWSQGRPAIRISGEDFLHSRPIRYRRGSDSPVGFFEDSFDDAAFRQLVLAPLTDGDRRIVRRIRDPRTDAPVDSPAEPVADGTLVIVDGSFLLRRSLQEYWGLKVFLTLTEVERVRRADDCERQAEEGGDGVAADHRQRRARGFALYLDQDDPEGAADIVIDTTDGLRPVPLRWPRHPRVGHRERPSSAGYRSSHR
jgi:uridine kinase